MRFPEQHRRKGFGQYGNDGLFDVPHQKISNYFYLLIISNGDGWDHVSVSLYSTERTVTRCPTWEEMCFVKELVFDDEVPAMQLHPKKSEYVNNHPYCLHLWRPHHCEIPTPDPLMVGFPNK